MSGRSLIRQCGECSILFLQSIEIVLSNPRQSLDCCPNPRCLALASKSHELMEAAVSWQFMHIVRYSGFSETRRMNLRELAEAEMGPWEFQFRSF